MPDAKLASRRVIFRSRWSALAALLILCLPLLMDAAHHLAGTHLHVPQSARMHQLRILAPVTFGLIAILAAAAIGFSCNRREILFCGAIALLFSYECARYAWWMRTRHLLHGPYSWIFWVPAIAALAARTVQLFRRPQN